MIPAPPILREVLLFGAVLVPALLALIWVVRPLRATAVSVAPWAALPALALAALSALDPTATVAVGWSGIATGLRLQVDPVGGPFLLLTALLWLAAGIFARGYHADDERRESFFGFFVLTMAGNLGVVLAGDLLGFYLSFAIMTFSAYGLVVHKRDVDAMRAGRVYIVMALVGEAALLAALFALGAAAGGSVGFGSELNAGWSALASPDAGAGGGGLPLGSAPFVATLFVVGFGVKAGLFPLHVWLPLAHPVAPTAASALLSGVMIKAGLLGWIRVLPAEVTLPALGGTLLVLGVVGAFYGVLVGLAQADPKTILAYSSVSQMGSMAMGTGLLVLAPGLAAPALAAVLFFALHHGVAKGALFLAVGLAGRTAAGRRARTWILFAAGVPALALAGAPFTSGALAKGALKGVLGELGGVWYGVMDPLLLVAAMGTTLLLARFLVVLGRVPGPGREEWTPGASLGVALPFVALVAASASGAWWIGRTVPPHPGMDFPSLLAGLGELSLPLLLGLVVAGAVLRWPQLAGRLAEIRVPPGDLLILIRLVVRIPRIPSPPAAEGARARARRGARTASAWMVSRTDALVRRDLLLMRGAIMGSLLLLIVSLVLSALLLDG